MSGRPRVIGYLRVSTQDLDLEKYKAEILDFANARNLGPVDWVEEKVSRTKTWRKREIGKVVESLKAGDWLIVPEIPRLGRSNLDVLDILNELYKKKVQVCALKGVGKIDGSISSKTIGAILPLVLEMERYFSSERTKEARKGRKAAGKPRGPKSKLDKYRSEIEELIKNGSSRIFIAKHYQVNRDTLRKWLKRNKISR